MSPQDEEAKAHLSCPLFLFYLIHSEVSVQRYWSEAKQLVRLASPILVAQVAQIAMNFVDTVMAGQVSAVDLAAVSVASSFWLPIILLVQGIIMALTPIVSQLNGARKQDEVRPAVHQGFWLALIVTPIAMVALYFSPLALQFMDVDPVMAAKTAGYLHAILWGLPAFVMFQVLRNFSEGLSHTMPTMVIGFVGLAVNIPANYIFIHGHFGMPKLGGVGCGVATAIVLWAMLLAMIVYVKCSAHFKRINLFAQLARPNGSRIWRLFRLGFPIAMAIFCEVTLFTVVALMLAPFGAETVASHQIALNFSSLVFMLPLSIGVGVTIRVGHNIGEGQPDQARVAARTGLMLGMGVAAATAALTVLLRDPIAGIYTDDLQVIGLAATLLFFAAIYQISDSVQVVAAAALRGYKDTQAIFYVTIVAYWGLGLPTGMILGLTDWVVPRMGPQGFWIGFIVGLTSAALMLGARLRVIYGRFASPAACTALSRAQ
ncbi:MATE family efflux transporter [Aeromonas caviae]|uniref:Multidrug-efflux transporter n=2 Tax=Aeromonas caviae TaxID=648 RepID=A0AA37FYA3_AERCA|nr:MATE family efflux transporter [Aeromonas caviae]BDA13776.1 MATE family efflux transporter [Aeromonas caviae]BDA18060.1 MATE family efflux transporter [Aeromonas caviae]BDC87051.1 MATE family efflux transporter [Aeromonas caviae]BDN88054.1 MATE family efflux transporter [Aeromonas caviae]